MGKADRVIWSSVAAGAAALILNGRLKGTPAVALVGLATLFLLTSLLGHCPVYAATGLYTLTAGDKLDLAKTGSFTG